MLGRAIVDGASLSYAGHGRIGAGATGALVQIELVAGIVDAGPKCARAFRRRQVSPATCPRVPHCAIQFCGGVEYLCIQLSNLRTFATWTTLAGIVHYSRTEAMEDGASLLGAGQPGTVASASHAWILGRGHRSIRRHHLSVHVASCESIVSFVIRPFLYTFIRILYTCVYYRVCVCVCIGLESYQRIRGNIGRAEEELDPSKACSSAIETR